MDMPMAMGMVRVLPKKKRNNVRSPLRKILRRFSFAIALFLVFETIGPLLYQQQSAPASWSRSWAMQDGNSNSNSIPRLATINRAPLCTLQQVQNGAWQPVMLDRAPYIPGASKCYTKEALETATEWPTYHWHPANKQCEYSQWDADLFCRVAHNKTIALGGDSLTWEHFASLAGLLGKQVGAHDQINSRDSDGNPYNQNKGVMLTVCNGSSMIAFYRNRYLLYVKSFLELTDPDVIVLNVGAHSMPEKNLMDGWPQKEGSGVNAIITLLHQHQQSCRVQGRDCLAIWRTLSPGHPQCSNFTKPINNRTAMEEWIQHSPQKYPGPAHFYNWWNYNKMNKLIVDTFQAFKEHHAHADNGDNTPFQFNELPAYDVNLLRPDGHVALRSGKKLDCLHNCDPGVVDVYNVLLLHLLRQHYGDRLPVPV
mmetsp:Transcript_38431/g.92648  ORF Transcript_38431/g.92648 Transcript_38431/m.92648 type:complete len:424 (-) Transcript_38431:448-1719(-)|eukprot:CAMPEP_0181118714 /NCGR_PEP_ID=MMETSP1071-20121207/23228_1 /TAXON_ID=35127 /ORGANISM="Thalassiosira sp., Strain NH16" /LENGTH=423 /DNA_ID=CAMNT_0023203237 /DNA_START=93 /DNA_END=1364 /DNA_ORIENTATION=-